MYLLDFGYALAYWNNQEFMSLYMLEHAFSSQVNYHTARGIQVSMLQCLHSHGGPTNPAVECVVKRVENICLDRNNMQTRENIPQSIFEYRYIGVEARLTSERLRSIVHY